MEQGDGAMIVGLEQFRVVEGIEKPAAEDTEVQDIRLPTPWNHIEAGMAFMLDLPILIMEAHRSRRDVSALWWPLGLHRSGYNRYR